METAPRRLVTIIVEARLEGAITRDLQKLGAKGYTVTDARGKGSGGLRSATWEADSNVRIEVLCSEDIARRILERLHVTYFDDFAMVAFVSEVQVLRPEKF